MKSKTFCVTLGSLRILDKMSELGVIMVSTVSRKGVFVVSYIAL